MRKLNLDEKRRIEKLMFADIEAKKEEYRAKRGKERKELIEKLNKHIPPEVQRAFSDYQKAEKEKKEKEEYIKKQGYHTTGWGDEERVEASDYGTQPAEAEEFNKETERTEKKLEALKKEYTLKLYADTDETQELFNDLMKRLDAVTK